MCEAHHDLHCAWISFLVYRDVLPMFMSSVCFLGVLSYSNRMRDIMGLSLFYYFQYVEFGCCQCVVLWKSPLNHCPFSGGSSGFYHVLMVIGRYWGDFIEGAREQEPFFSSIPGRMLRPRTSWNPRGKGLKSSFHCPDFRGDKWKGGIPEAAVFFSLRS